jgi:hypothetical protein
VICSTGLPEILKTGEIPDEPPGTTASWFWVLLNAAGSSKQMFGSETYVACFDPRKFVSED